MVPNNAVKVDPSVSSCAEAIHLFESLRFWMVEEIPADFVEYALTSNNPTLPPSFWIELGDQFPWLHVIKDCMEISKDHSCEQMKRILAVGNRELLEVAFKILQCMPINACALAIQSGSAECLRFVYGNSSHPHLGCSSAIEYGGDEQLLATVHELGAEWDAKTCNVAVQRDSLCCLKYLHEHGCPWKWVCIEAAHKGSVACLQYAHEQGSPWDAEVCRVAA